MTLIIRELGIQPYEKIWVDMKSFTQHRHPETPDELWVLQHHPVYTQGQAGKPEHILQQTDIPIVQSDRGGQVTYHGPGQLIVYTLIDLQRSSWGIRTLVQSLEQLVINFLKNYGLQATTTCGAPGVYLAGAKICSLGLRVRHGRAYHGLALNIDMDLAPFDAINPCGFKNMKMTQLADHIDHCDVGMVFQSFISMLKRNNTLIPDVSSLAN